MRLAALALVAACGGAAAPEPEPAPRPRPAPPAPVYSEGEAHLRRLKDAAERYAIEHGGFPVGAAPATPATSCCDAGGTCAPERAAWQGVWRELDFALDAPHRFRLSYESADGTAFTATAVSDLDCDGEESLYILQGSWNDGAPRFGLMRPPAED